MMFVVPFGTPFEWSLVEDLRLECCSEHRFNADFSDFIVHYNVR
jgi:hypothetical protein